MNLEEKLKYAKKIINGYHYKDKFSKLYPFTTENLNGYMSEYNFMNKDVLTVGSSCDQIFNAHLLGARNIVCFDTNPLSEEYFNLKNAAFKTLEFEEFVRFFCLFPDNFFNSNKLVFDNDTFNKLLPCLEGDSYYFWSNLFCNYPGNKIRRRLFINDEEPFKVLSKCNKFMTENGYEEMKKKIYLLHPSFITCDLRNIYKELSEKFDYIMLSNIACFIQKMYYNPLEDFRDNIIKLSEYLNDNGTLFLAYLYDIDHNTKPKSHWDTIYHLDYVFRVFKNYNISSKYFTGIKGIIKNDEKLTDMVLTLKK